MQSVTFLLAYPRARFKIFWFYGSLNGGSIHCQKWWWDVSSKYITLFVVCSSDVYYFCVFRFWCVLLLCVSVPMCVYCFQPFIPNCFPRTMARLANQTIAKSIFDLIKLLIGPRALIHPSFQSIRCDRKNQISPFPKYRISILTLGIIATIYSSILISIFSKASALGGLQKASTAESCWNGLQWKSHGGSEP